MIITKTKLRRIIREAIEQYSLPLELKDLEERHSRLLSFMNGQASSPGGSYEDMKYNANQVVDLEEKMHAFRKDNGLPPKDYIEYSLSMYRRAVEETVLGRYESYRRKISE